jgi:ankyrin repeat protein
MSSFSLIFFGETALHLACEYGHHEVVLVVLVHPGIDVNQKNGFGSTSFIIGCEKGKVEVVKVLLKDSRVDINLADRGRTPLWHASYEGHVEVIKWIIASGREVDLDKKGRHEIRVELSVPDALVAEIFAMVVFLCDGLLKANLIEEARPETPRFLNIAQRLPMELQMILCYAVYDLGKENILSKDSEPAFRFLAQQYLPK